MDAATATLQCDLVAWLAPRPRPYAEVMEVWRTSCPRLAIWEEALERGLVVRERRPGAAALVRVTPAGQALLRAAGRAPEGLGAAAEA